MDRLIVRPITKQAAVQLCALHPHATTLPKSGKYWMAAYLDGRPAGLAVWGYGVNPRGTANALFGEAGRYEDHLELCRFFVFDWCPKYTATRFLAVTHRLLRTHTTVRWLFTYAAGFQGLIGTIYQAANYEYCGPHPTNAFIYVPNVGLVHRIPLHHRYGETGWPAVAPLFPGSRRWHGVNFQYIYWLDPTARAELIPHARFPVGLPNPTVNDLHIEWELPDGTREPLSVEFAKSVPIVKLPTRRAGSIDGDAPTFPGGSEGGSIPTPALQ